VRRIEMSSENVTADRWKACYSNGTGSCVEVGPYSSILVRHTTEHGYGLSIRARDGVVPAVG
jgi:hypothetical protein